MIEIDGKTYRNLEEQVQKNTYDINHMGADLIKSGSEEAGKVLTADGEGGAVWGAGSGSGMENPMRNLGDIILGGVAGTPTALGKGLNGQVLKVTNGIPQWGANSLNNIDEVAVPFGTPTVLYDTTDGINITGTARITDKQAGTHDINIDVDIPIQPGAGINIDADEDTEHIVISSDNPNPMTAAGDLIVGGVNGAPTKLSKGVNTQVLTMIGSTPGWSGISVEGEDILSSGAGEGLVLSSTQEGGSEWREISEIPAGGTAGEFLKKGSSGPTWDTPISGTNDGTNWTSLTIEETDGKHTYNIPSGGGGGGMVNPMTSVGDLIMGGTAGAPARIAKGSANQVLTMSPDGVNPIWANSSGGMVDPTTTNGDMIYRAGNAIRRLPKGSANQVLTMAPDGSLPIWATQSGLVDPTTTDGDLIYRFNGALTRLGKGSSTSQYLGISNASTGKLAWKTITLPTKYYLHTYEFKLIRNSDSAVIANGSVSVIQKNSTNFTDGFGDFYYSLVSSNSIAVSGWYKIQEGTDFGKCDTRITRISFGGSNVGIRYYRQTGDTEPGTIQQEILQSTLHTCTLSVADSIPLFG